MEAERAILDKLATIARLMPARDRSIVDEFCSGPDFVLIGSEAGEETRGRAELEALIEGFFAQPFRLSWEWERHRFSESGSVAWITAEGSLVVTTEEGVERKPYRLTAIFEKIAGNWHWRLYSGSEPV